MKRFFIFFLVTVMLALPLCSAFADDNSTGFTHDMARLRTILDQVDNASLWFTGYSDEFFESCLKISENDFFSTYSRSDYPYYFAVPVLVGDVSPSPYSPPDWDWKFVYVYFFAAPTDDFNCYLEYFNWSDGSLLGTGDYGVRLRFHSFPAGTVGMRFGFSFNSYSSSHTSSSLASYISDPNSGVSVSNLSPYLVHGRNYASDSANYRTNYAPYAAIPSVDFLTSHSVVSAHVAYVNSDGSPDEDGINDFFTIRSLSVIVSMEMKVFLRRFEKAAVVLVVCGVGLTASLIGLNLLPRVLRRFL